MRDNNERPPGFTRQSDHLVLKHICRVGIQIAGRLIRKNNVRVVHERTGDRDPLLLPSREHTGSVVHSSSETESLEQIRGLPACVGESRLPDQRRHRHVLDGCKFRKQVVKLEDKAYGSISKGCEFLVVSRKDVLTLEEYAACIRAIEGSEDMEKRAFARPALTNHRDDLTGGNRKINRIQNNKSGAGARRIGLAKSFGGKKRHFGIGSATEAVQGTLPFDAVFVHLVVEVRSLDSDGLRRLADVPVELIELVNDEDLFGLISKVAELIEPV